MKNLVLKGKLKDLLLIGNSYGSGYGFDYCGYASGDGLGDGCGYSYGCGFGDGSGSSSVYNPGVTHSYYKVKEYMKEQFKIAGAEIEET
jgi:hypothetical protein